MLIKDVMTPSPVCCKRDDKLDTVAKLMLDHDCGEIPVCNENKLIGVITDRDIVLRAVAVKKDPKALTADDVMTRHVYTVAENDKLSDALELMEKKLVRRLPVIDDSGNIVGILSQADLVAKSPTLRVARAMKAVSERTRKQASVAW